MNEIWQTALDSMYKKFDPKPKKAHEIANEWRKEFYRLDADLNKAWRAVEMHPEKYVMGYTIMPDAIYNHELARAKYEMGLELVTLLKSRPEEPQPKNYKIVDDGSIDERGGK